MEGAPLALGDKNVARLFFTENFDQLAEIFGKAARRCGEGLIDRLPQGVFEILGEAYIHENDRRPCFAEGVRERAAGLRDPVCRVRLQVRAPMMPFCRSMRTSAVVLGSSSSMFFRLSD